VLLVLFLIGCQNQAQIPNPASKFCIDKGFQNKIVTNEDGSQTGFCMVLVNNKTVECEEWKYYRGECPVIGEVKAEENKTELTNETKMKP